MSTVVEMEEVELEVFAARGEAAPHAHRYVIRIDEERMTVHQPDPTGSELLARVGKRPCAYALVQILRHQDDEFIDPEERVDLRRHGVERFITVHKDDVTITVGETSVTLRRGTVAVSEIKRRRRNRRRLCSGSGHRRTIGAASCQWNGRGPWLRGLRQPSCRRRGVVGGGALELLRR